MPSANEVFQAAKRGQVVRHRNLHEIRYMYSQLYVRSGASETGWTPLHWGETELDPDAWTIEPKADPVKAPEVEYIPETRPDPFAGLDASLELLSQAIAGLSAAMNRARGRP